jgi:hypothetical protein
MEDTWLLGLLTGYGQEGNQLREASLLNEASGANVGSNGLNRGPNRKGRNGGWAASQCVVYNAIYPHVAIMISLIDRAM